MSPLLLTILTFLGGALAVAGVYSVVMDLYWRDRGRVNQRLEEEFQSKASAVTRKLPIFKDLESLPDANPDKARSWDLRRQARSLIEQSGLKITLTKMTWIAVASALGLGLPAWLFAKSIWLGLLVAAIGLAIPPAYVYVIRKRRMEKLLAQLPDVFDLISRLLRAGQTTSQAFQGVADEFDPPIATEFAYCYEQQNLGLSPEVALRDMARRINQIEMKIFILAVLVQRQTGGNLAELIDNLAAMVRERYRIRGKIKILTAEGRIEASVLLALPPVVFLVILFLNRNYALVLLEHPNLIYTTLGFMLVGVLWIRKIISFDF